MTVPTVAQFTALQREAISALIAAATPTALEAWRVKYLGRKGAVPRLLRNIKQLPVARRRAVGAAGNALRQALQEQYLARQKQLSQRLTPLAPSTAAGQNIKLLPRGHLHPLTLTMRRIMKIMSELGFQIVEGPLVEETRFVFDLLNIPPEHPARSMMDTFHVSESYVLRPHTSPMQLRAVFEQQLAPPYKIFSPGRVFRAERTDASHSHTFYQFEGLAIGEKITLADFKGVIATLYTQFFNKNIAVRLRPSYFPFVEPGLEVDINCVFCQGHGCSVCAHTGWIEMMGAGLVHPNVLRHMNLDPEKYQGYAFGGAIDRLAMLRHGINDIRLFWSGDLRFVRQF